MRCQRKPNDLLKRLGDRAFWKSMGGTTMQCDCKDKYLEAVKKHVVAQAPQGSEGFDIELAGYGMTFGGDGVNWIFKVDVKGEYKAPKKAGGMKSVKVNTFISANFCPFCGVKCKADEAEAA
jgi:hypothetical protein